MGKKKIALFYDESTESGKQILEFLTPFDKRKSDIVGELILLWIAEHGTNVPVQWLNRKKGELGAVKPSFPVRVPAVHLEEKEQEVSGFAGAVQNTSESSVSEITKDSVEEKSQEMTHDVSLIKAGLASFM